MNLKILAQKASATPFGTPSLRYEAVRISAFYDFYMPPQFEEFRFTRELALGLHHHLPSLMAKYIGDHFSKFDHPKKAQAVALFVQIGIELAPTPHFSDFLVFVSRLAAQNFEVKSDAYRLSRNLAAVLPFFEAISHVRKLADFLERSPSATSVTPLPETKEPEEPSRTLEAEVKLLSPTQDRAKKMLLRGRLNFCCQELWQRFMQGEDLDPKLAEPFKALCDKFPKAAEAYNIVLLASKRPPSELKFNPQGLSKIAEKLIGSAKPFANVLAALQKTEEPPLNLALAIENMAQLAAEKLRRGEIKECDVRAYLEPLGKITDASIEAAVVSARMSVIAAKVEANIPCAEELAQMAKELPGLLEQNPDRFARSLVLFCWADTRLGANLWPDKRYLAYLTDQRLQSEGVAVSFPADLLRCLGDIEATRIVRGQEPLLTLRFIGSSYLCEDLNYVVKPFTEALVANVANEKCVSALVSAISTFMELDHLVALNLSGLVDLAVRDKEKTSPVAKIIRSLVQLRIQHARPLPVGEAAQIARLISQDGLALCEVAEFAGLLGNVSLAGANTVWQAVLRRSYEPFLSSKRCMSGLPKLLDSYFDSFALGLESGPQAEFRKVQGQFFEACDHLNQRLAPDLQEDLPRFWDTHQHKIIQLTEIFGAFAFSIVNATKGMSFNAMDRFLAAVGALPVEALQALSTYVQSKAPHKTADIILWKDVVTMLASLQFSDSTKGLIAFLRQNADRAPEELPDLLRPLLLDRFCRRVGAAAESKIDERVKRNIGALFIGMRFLVRNGHDRQKQLFEEMMGAAMTSQTHLRQFLFDGSGQLARHNRAAMAQMQKLGVKANLYVNYPKTRAISLTFHAAPTKTENPDEKPFLEKLEELRTAIAAFQTANQSHKRTTEGWFQILGKLGGHSGLKNFKKNSAVKSGLQKIERSFSALKVTDAGVSAAIASCLSLACEDEDAAESKSLKSITRNITIRQFRRDPQRDVWIPMMVGCCLEPTSNQYFYAMPERLAHASAVVHEAVWDDTGETLSCNWLFCCKAGDKPVVVSNYHEMNADVARLPGVRNVVMGEMLAFGRQFVSDVSAKKLAPVRYIIRQLSYGNLPPIKGLKSVACDVEVVGGFLPGIEGYFQARYEKTFLSGDSPSEEPETQHVLPTLPVSLAHMAA